MSKKKKHKQHKQHNVSKQKQLQIIKAFYKRNLDIFVERELNVKLTKWQRFILKRMRLKDGKKQG